MRVPISKLYLQAYGRFGIGAFNVFNAEQVHGVFRGAQKANAPVIIQLTPVARNYLNPEMLEALIASAEKIYPEVIFTVHLDHGNYDHCINAINSGYYQSVMIDASDQSFAENVRITEEIVKKAHTRGISVEAELGVLSGMEDHLSIDKSKALYTDPKQVVDFVRKTDCDSLAVAVGTSHGAYKFSGGRGLQLSILAEIQKNLPGFPLVLHGASAVPLDEVDRINRAGGKLNDEAKGVDGDELLAAIRYGVSKINIATDMRLIWTRIHREFFRDQPDKFDMVIPGKGYMNALESFVVEKCTFLLANNKMKVDEKR
jgi:fructose-bisphosphate aldolase class II